MEELLVPCLIYGQSEEFVLPPDSKRIQWETKNGTIPSALAPEYNKFCGTNYDVFISVCVYMRTQNEKTRILVSKNELACQVLLVAHGILFEEF